MSALSSRFHSSTSDSVYLYFLESVESVVPPSIPPSISPHHSAVIRRSALPTHTACHQLADGRRKRTPRPPQLTLCVHTENKQMWTENSNSRCLTFLPLWILSVLVSPSDYSHTTSLALILGPPYLFLLFFLLLRLLLSQTCCCSVAASLSPSLPSLLCFHV